MPELFRMPDVDENNRDSRFNPGLAILGLAFVLYFFFQVQAPLRRLHCNDFKHLYMGARILRQGHNPYNAERMLYESFRTGFNSILPYVYLPFTGLVLSPLTYLPFRTAALFWFYFNHVLVMAGLGLLFQGSMLFIGLIIFLLLQPLLTTAPFVLVDVVVVFIMGLICFVPFALYVRGVVSNRNSSPA